MSSSGETSDLKVLKEVKCGSFFLRWVRNVDMVIAVCRKASDELLQNGFSKAKVIEIPNGVDTDRFVKNNYKGKNKPLTITFVGRLDSYKGVDFLLKGFKEILLKRENVKLNIIGNGPDKLLLKSMAEDLNIVGSVNFKGKQENIARELSITDIFVLPSLSEGMSNVLLEAMSCGLPVVTTSVGGNEDLIKDRHNGILVPPRNPGRLAEAIQELFENERLARRLGERARETVEEHYTMSRIVSNYITLYNRLMSQSNVGDGNVTMG